MWSQNHPQVLLMQWFFQETTKEIFVKEWQMGAAYQQCFSSLEILEITQDCLKKVAIDMISAISV